jgi:hypothetical protein
MSLKLVIKGKEYPVANLPDSTLKGFENRRDDTYPEFHDDLIVKVTLKDGSTGEARLGDLRRHYSLIEEK